MPKMKVYGRALICLVLISWVGYGATAEDEQQAPADECPRYSAREFKSSVFDPVMDKQLSLLAKTFSGGVEGIVDILSGLKGKKASNKLEADSMLKDLSHYSQTFEFLLGKAKSNVDTAWMRLLHEARSHEPDQDGEQIEEVKEESSEKEKETVSEGKNPTELKGDISDFRLPIQRIHQEIHAVDVALEETFEQLAKTAKGVLDPLVKVVSTFMNKAADISTEAGATTRTKLLEALKSKNKLFGRVLSLLLQSQLDNKEPDPHDFVEHINHLWNELTVLLYDKGIREKMDWGSFWQLALQRLWQREDSFCPNKETEADVADCEEDMAAKLIAAAMFYTEGDVDLSVWFKEARDQLQASIKKKPETEK